MTDFTFVLSALSGTTIVVLLVGIIVKTWQFINTPYDPCYCGCEDDDTVDEYDWQEDVQLASDYEAGHGGYGHVPVDPANADHFEGRQ